MEITPFTDKSIQLIVKEHPELYAAQKRQSVSDLENKPGVLCFCTCHPLEPFTGWVPLTDEVLLTKPLNLRKENYAKEG